jgi:phage shock protein A
VPEKNILTRLADAGEDAIARLGDAPGADRMLGAVNTMRDRTDELQRRLRGVDELEKRVAELERRLDALAPKRTTAAARKPAAKKATTVKKSTTAAKAAKTPKAP